MIVGRAALNGRFQYRLSAPPNATRLNRLLLQINQQYRQNALIEEVSFEHDKIY
jgi:hypothetical protein